MEVGIIGSFVDVMPDLEVLCDQMEEFFLNKHFNEEKMGRRLYFKEEDIQKLRYHLAHQNHIRSKDNDDNEQDMMFTADSDFFSFAKA